MEEKRARILELVEQLNHAAAVYYQGRDEVMSNYEYDKQYDELQALEKETGIVLAGSPTQRVGYEVLSELPKEQHPSPMLSLDKTKDTEQLAAWLGEHPGLLSWKMDGLTIVLTYQEGTLQKAVTRGNGQVGEVITGNARMFDNVPLQIPFQGELVLRGEAVITYSRFREINESLPVEEQYKNPRNLCSGSVRQLDSRVTKSRHVNFFAFSLVTAEGVDFKDSQENKFKFLQEQGFEVTILPVDGHGVVKLDALEKALRPDTILVSTMMVNNETGAVMPVEKIGAMIQEKCPKALYHVDAIQAFGKYRIYPKKWNIHLLSVSSHKIHGPKGVGFLYINSKAKVQPLILGGGQQNGMRSGTDNVPGIAGLGVAAKMMYQNFDEKAEHLYQLKERMAEGLSKMNDVVINGMPVREGAPHILSVSFLGIRSEVLLHTLEDRNIYVSAGSACSSHKRKPSATLSAMGMSNAQIENTVRISFSEENTFEEVDYCLEVLNEVLPMLKRYARR